MSQNESAIEQINLGFNEREDRLLLRVGLADKTEVAVWITRRVCKAMWNLLHGLANTTMPIPIAPQFALPAIATPEANEYTFESFSREAAEPKQIESLDFKSEYLVDRESRFEAPMLATQCLIIDVVGLSPQLELQCTNGQSVKIALTPQLVHAVTNMMQLATREAGWDLLMTVDTREVSIISSHQTVH
jgi:hypothetical protein